MVLIIERRKKNTMFDNISTLDCITTMESILDQLVDAKGRDKCGLICVAADIAKRLRNDVLILEEKVKDKEKSDQSVPPPPIPLHTPEEKEGE
jgi:hypothetical protein